MGGNEVWLSGRNMIIELIFKINFWRYPLELISGRSHYSRKDSFMLCYAVCAVAFCGYFL